MGGKKGFTHENSKLKTIYNKIEKLEVGESFNKVEFILTMYDYHDYFVQRSFDVLYCKTKKMFPERCFKCKDKKIIRIS